MLTEVAITPGSTRGTETSLAGNEEIADDAAAARATGISFSGVIFSTTVESTISPDAAAACATRIVGSLVMPRTCCAGVHGFTLGGKVLAGACTAGVGFGAVAPEICADDADEAVTREGVGAVEVVAAER